MKVGAGPPKEMLQSYAEASKNQCVLIAQEKSLCQKPMLLGTDYLTDSETLCNSGVCIMYPALTETVAYP